MAKGYTEQQAMSRELEEKMMAMERNLSSRPVKSEAPDHHSVGSMINLLSNDMAQLIGEIGELRARLTPVMADRNHEKVGVPGMPVQCQVAAELGDVYQRLAEARRLIYMTMTEIDL